jgi:ribosomal-protein-alanine N-acetyltransferase
VNCELDVISPSEPQHVNIQAGQLLIRRMRAQDVPEVMEIESVSFGRHHWSEDSFHNEMNNQVGRYYSLLDTQKNRLIGYCGFWLVIDEVHITTVAVHPDYRGNALGELMVVQAIERSMSQSMHWVTLEVRVSNYSAQNLYYKYGFSSVGIRPKYYQDNQEDALIMTTADILSEAYRNEFRRLKLGLQERLHGLPAGFGQS